MHTDSVTESITIDAAPAAVLDLLADPVRLPEWAPAFARAVESAGDEWIVQTDSGPVRTLVRVCRESGTVDVVRAADPGRGAFLRVLASGTGSRCVLTVQFPRTDDRAARDRQAEIVAAEVRAIRALSGPAR